ncbi:MAG: hypothetical protein WC664_03660 [Patescibacteria group bacterium]|jgi:hypothetical protein
MDDYKPISQKELERGYFIVTHRLLINKIVFGLVIFILIILYGALIVMTFNYFRGPSFNASALAIQNNTFDWSTYHNSRAPEEITISKPEFTSLGDRRYNITALVENKNKNWAVKSMDYHFVSQGESTPSKTAFINPDDKRLLALTAYQSDIAIRNPELVVSNLEWYRIDDTFPVINIDISNIVFHAASRETVDGVTSDLPARVSWQAYNDSVYNFWEIDWQVALYNGDKLVAINELKSKDFLALENRELETVWLNSLPRVTRSNIFPLLNKLDKSIFKDIYVTPKVENR